VTGPFSRRTVIWLAVVAGLSLFLGVGLVVFEQDVQETRSNGPDTFSYSAVGHRGWAEILRAMGRNVVVSRTVRAPAKDDDLLLVVAEPNADNQSGRLRDLLAGNHPVLLVLPKWTGHGTLKYADNFITIVSPVEESEVRRVLEAAGLADAKLVRLGRDDTPKNWTSGWGATPELKSAQLLKSPTLVPIVSSDEGVLVGRIRRPGTGGHEIYVLSDPDVIANHGLLHGDNAHVAVMAATAAAGHDAAVVFDETIHGFELHRSLVREMFAFPMVLVPAHVALALAVLLWAGMTRFGPAQPVAAELAAGRRTLIENTAELLAYGGHAGHSLSRYFRRAVESVGRGTGAAAGGDAMEAARRASARRGAEGDVDALDEEVRAVAGARGRPGGAATERRALEVAERIHEWRREVLDES
jgi:hypothetical protein